MPIVKPIKIRLIELPNAKYQWVCFKFHLAVIDQCSEVISELTETNISKLDLLSRNVNFLVHFRWTKQFSFELFSDPWRNEAKMSQAQSGGSFDNDQRLVLVCDFNVLFFRIIC